MLTFSKYMKQQHGITVTDFEWFSHAVDYFDEYRQHLEETSCTRSHTNLKKAHTKAKVKKQNLKANTK